MFIAPVFPRSLSGLIASGHALRNLCRSNFPSQQTSSPPWNLPGARTGNTTDHMFSRTSPALRRASLGFNSIYEKSIKISVKSFKFNNLISLHNLCTLLFHTRLTPRRALRQRF
jgi:hypothetical protein